MPWVRIDDHFDEHPKMAAVGPVGWGVWLAGLAYCNRNLTDGFIPYAIAEGIGGAWTIREPVDHDDEDGARSVRRGSLIWTIDRGSGMHGESMTTQWIIDQLVRVGLWQEVDGGYRIHDYDEYQPTKAQVLFEREQKAAAGRAGGIAAAKARAKAPAQAKSKPVPVPNPVPVPVPKSVPAPANALRSARENGRPAAIGSFIDRVVLEDVIG
jgi:hypothetical protein